MVACANPTATETLQSALNAASYTAGDSFAITLNLNGNWGGLTTSDSHLTLNTQTYGGVQYVNFTNGNSGWPAVNDWELSKNEITGNNDSVEATFTITSTTQPTGYWITPIVQVTNDGEYQVCNGVRSDVMSSFTIAYDKETNSAIFTAVRTLSSGTGYHQDPTNWQSSTSRTNTEYNNLNYTITTNYVVQGLELDASKFNISNNGISSVNVVVPEPATATLSLLALAGLAARRRRK